MSLKSTIKSIFISLYTNLKNQKNRLLKTWYIVNGKKAWRLGYSAYRWDIIQRLISQANLLDQLRQGKSFTPYGIGLDERIVEYPWVFANLSSHASVTLDAGSALNFRLLIKNLKSQKRDLTIFTLAPERNCFWRESVSYQYGDLKKLPFQSEWFDEIISISTLEHIGMDNSYYGATSEVGTEEDFVVAMRELVRVLKPKGNFLITLPYGARDYLTLNDVVFARQFDADLLQQLIQSTPEIQFEVSFFRYTELGWESSTQEACAGMHYFNIHIEKDVAPDGAAAARAVVCLKGTKRA
ncbi:MAG: methyltransferase domain-containing protein [bacterium]|nr:methyltransferase domain-containing protein [bacterium]